MSSKEKKHLRQSTTLAKGDAFEQRMFRVLKRELLNGQLGFVPGQCRIFQKKGYESRDRGSSIIFDISIELTLPTAKNWSLLWLWECKNYGKPVPVDDVEEFWAKVQQVAGLNVKAGFATVSPLSTGALNFAKAKGFAVIRMAEERQAMSWVLHSQWSTITDELLEDYLTAGDFPSSAVHNEWIGMVGSVACRSWLDVFETPQGHS